MLVTGRPGRTTAIERLIDAVCAVGAIDQRVTVRRRLGAIQHPDVAASPGDVLHHQWLTELFCHAHHDQAGKGIAAAPCGEWHDQVDRLIGVRVLSQRGCSSESRERDSQQGCGRSLPALG